MSKQSPNANLNFSTLGHGRESPEQVAVQARWSVRQMVAGGSLLALTISVVLHVVGVFATGLVTVGFFDGGREAGGGESSSQVEMALLTEAELAGGGDEAISVEQPLVPESADAPFESSTVSESLPTDPSLGIQEGPSEIGGGGGAGDVSTGAGGMGLGGAGSGGAKFFGVEATGTRFAYVVDLSGSMAGPRLEALRTELTHSIVELPETAQFLVVPFSNEAEALGKRDTWTEASPTGKRWAKNTIALELKDARDGTVPLPGFQIAYSVRPRPDSIYFMTDGESFPAGTADELKVLSAQFKVPIHCIRFGDKESAGHGGANSAESIMRAIAKQSGGSYKLISIQ